MDRQHARRLQLRDSLLTAMVSGPLWGAMMFLMQGGDVNGPALAVASAGFGVIMGAYMYWTVGRRIASNRTDELALHHSRTLAVAAPPEEVFEVLHSWLKDSGTHTMIDASREFGTLRARHPGAGLYAGEDVAVHLVAQGGGTAIRIDSHTANPIQRMDDGHNKRNVDAIADMLMETFDVELESARRAQQVRRRAPVREGGP